MNSFLLVDKHDQKHEEMAISFCSQKEIDPIDITIINADDSKEEKNYPVSSKKGIALVRQVIQAISLKPIRTKQKAVVILHAEKLSLPAQNALLKTLEEPPPGTFLILTSENENLLLTTILSRCSIIFSKNKNDNSLKESDTREFQTFSAADSLAKAEELAKDKKSALSFLEAQIKSLDLLLKKNAVSSSRGENLFEIKRLLANYLDTYSMIKTTNVNLRFALENLFLAVTSAVSKNSPFAKS